LVSFPSSIQFIHEVPYLECLWCREESFSNLIKDLLKMYQLDFIAILEPCISGPNADKVINKIGLDGCFRVDANGFLGGNWCLWRTSGTNISVMGSFPYHVHLHINPKLHKPWFLTIFCVIP